MSYPLYEYSPNWLFDAERRGQRADATAHAVFSSYASLLGHIQAIEIDGIRVPAATRLHG